MVLTVVTMSMSSTVFSTTTTTTAPSVAFGERIVIDSQQVVTVSTTNGIDQDNNSTIDRHISSLGKLKVQKMD